MKIQKKELFIYVKYTFFITLSLLLLAGCQSETTKEKPGAETQSGEQADSTSQLDNIEKAQYKIMIGATPEEVYAILTDEEHFKTWTAPFSATSYFEGTWEKDSIMRFISLDDEGNKMGMVSRIRENIPGKLISIEHLGYIQNGEEILEGEEIEAFKGALENYSLTPNGDSTEMRIDTDIFIELTAYFDETWPVSLKVLKSICEKNEHIK